MRVAIISPFVFRLLRGIERFSINLANALAARDQHVTLLTWAGPLETLATSLAPSVDVRVVPSVRYFEAQWAVPFFAAQLARRQFDAVNVFFAGYGEAWAIRLARRQSHFAVNFIVDYPPHLVPHRYREFQTTGLAKRLDNIIVKTRALAPTVENLLGRPTVVLPSGVDVGYFAPDPVGRAETRAEFGIAPEEMVWLTVAALEERKGVRLVLEAMARLRQTFPCRYLVVGEGPDRATLTAQMRALGLEGCVRLVGAQTDVRKFYRAADLFLLPSFGEAFPNALLEAMSVGLPSVVADAPPYDELVLPTFGIRAARTPEMVTDAIAALLRDAPRRAEMGSAARARAVAEYDWDSVAGRYIDFFQRQKHSKVRRA